MLDRILRPFRRFSRAYLDDVPIYSRTLDDYEEHLDVVFSTFNNLGISLSPHKSFLSYPTATILGQRVSGLGLSTHQDKVQAILNLQFPDTLYKLEHYIRLTGWQRHYIPYYAQIIEPLQTRKVALLKDAPVKKGPRRRFTTKTAVGETRNLESEMQAYNLL